MNQHLEQSKVNHEILILSTVKELKQKSEQKDLEIKELKHKGEQKDLEIEELRKKNGEKDISFHEMKNNLEVLRREFDQLTTKMENNEKETKSCFDEMKQSQTQQTNRIDDLETFADRCSKIHLTLSQSTLRRNDHYGFSLFQENYDTSGSVKKWNKLVEEINEDDNKCEYLKKLKHSINQYQKTIYSLTYEERLRNFGHFTPTLTERGGFIKVGCHVDVKHICVKLYRYWKNFTSEIEKIDEQRTCKVQNNDVCSFYIGDCLHVVLYGYWRNIYLLHYSEEDKKLNLPKGSIVKLDDIFEYIIDDSIVLYLRH